MAASEFALCTYNLLAVIKRCFHSPTPRKMEWKGWADGTSALFFAFLWLAV